MRSHQRSAFIMALLIGGVSPALASGQLPPYPLEPRRFASFEECQSFLEERHRSDLQKADPHPMRNEFGSSQTLIDTQGVLTPEPHVATYEVTEGWQHRRAEPDIGQIVTSYSYEKTSMRCKHGLLTGESYQGYALQGYDDLPKNWDPTK